MKSLQLLAVVVPLVVGCGSSQPTSVIAPARPIEWEYTVLPNEHGSVVPQAIHNLTHDGWEVQVVAGGYPYVATSTTAANGVTTNIITYTPRAYFLRREKQAKAP